MSRLSRADKILLFTLTPLFVVVFSLHLREAGRTGIAQAPFFAAPAAESGGYPLIGGPRLEHGVDRSGLRVGDRLIRVGDVDLAGYGYLGFDAIVVEQAGLAARAPLVYERDGERQTIELQLVPYPQPYMRVPFLLSLAMMGLFVLLRAPGIRDSRLVFVAAMSFAIAELHFFGGSRWQSYASLLLFNFGGGIAIWAIIRWLIAFPAEVPESKRLSPALAWLGLLFVFMRLNYILGGPIPTQLIPRATLASDALFACLFIGIISWNTVHAPAVGRRRAKWLLLGAYIALSSILLSLVPSFIEVEGVEYFQSLPYGMLLGAAFPLASLVAILRYDLFDIDRILTSTAAYSIAFAGAILVLITAAPTVTAVLSRSMGVAEQTTLALLAVALIVVFAPLGRLVRAGVDRVVLPEQRLRESGFQRLFVDLADCSSADETLGLLRARVDALLEPEFAVLMIRQDGIFASSDPNSSLGTLPARGRLAIGLEAHPRPLSSVDRSLQQRLAQLTDDERNALEGRGVCVIVPIRCGKDLIALLCIGAARSGDIHTPTDLTLLAAAAERAGAELVRLEGAESLERERVRSSELATLKEQAEQANLAKSRFLAAASHDLRQPLHALGLFVDHLEEGVKGEAAGELVAKIRQSTGALTDMFTTLLDLSRLDAGAVHPELCDVDVDALFARFESELAPQAFAKGLDFVAYAPGGHVRSDPQLLARIIQNLLANAIRYTERGRVELSAREVAGDMEIAVADTGPGIPVEEHKRVFEEFVQLGVQDRRKNASENASGNARGKGIGLGLSIVDRLSRVLGHPLSLDSSSSGSRFTLRVPRSSVSGAVPAPDNGSLTNGSLADLSGTRVLVVDDDLAILDAMRTTLRGWGCSVILAASVEDALAGIEQRGEPDVILADHRLQGGTTGVETIGEIRRVVGRQVPAAVITGETTRLGELAGRDLVHMTKPVSPLTLRATLAELIRTK